jgi:hypothetical protein
LPILHHESDALELRDVGDRISRTRDKRFAEIAARLRFAFEEG